MGIVYAKDQIVASKRKSGVAKSLGYQTGLYCPEYDLEEMIIAFGVKRVGEMIIEAFEGLKEGKRYKDRSKSAKKAKQLVGA